MAKTVWSTKLTDAELIGRLNSLEKRIFALQRDLPDIIMTALRQHLLELAKNSEAHRG